MLIVQVEPPQSTSGADYFYRTHAPGLAMAQDKDVVVVNMTNVHRRKDVIMREADVLVLVNICDPDLLLLIRERTSKGKLTVYEIADDVSAVQPWNPVYSFYQNTENLSLMFRLATCCDALQVSVPELKKLYGHLNTHCEVFLNQVSHVPPERALKTKNEVFIGWGGSHGHLEDMAEIAGPLIHWTMDQPNVILDLMCSKPIWDLFAPLPRHKKRHTSPGSIDDYYKFLSQIDIGIGPLKDTAFNRSRSDIKFLEYAISGVVPVMAYLEPYADSVQVGKTGFLFSDPKELISILNQLLDNIWLRQEIAETARQYVIRERLQVDHGLDRIQFYKALIKQTHKPDPQLGQGLIWLEEWSSLEGAVREGNHLRLGATHFENLLHDGLVLTQGKDDKDTARLLFERAATIEPENHLPYLFGASVSAHPIAYLRKALELKPDSVFGWLLLGEEFAKSGRIQEALRSFDSAVRLYPDYEIPYLRAAFLLKRLGNHSAAKKPLQKVKELDIYHLLLQYDSEQMRPLSIRPAL